MNASAEERVTFLCAQASLERLGISTIMISAGARIVGISSSCRGKSRSGESGQSSLCQPQRESSRQVCRTIAFDKATSGKEPCQPCAPCWPQPGSPVCRSRCQTFCRSVAQCVLGASKRLHSLDQWSASLPESWVQLARARRHVTARHCLCSQFGQLSSPPGRLICCVC